MCSYFARILLLLALVNVSQSSEFAKDNEAKSSVGNEIEDGKSSLAFVFDTTGSMYNDLKQLREGAEMILNTALEESGIIGDFVFAPFHDPAVGPATVTRDKQVFKQALEAVSVYGGGDCPEKSLGGIQLALNVSEPRSFIYVFTDATAGDHRLVGKVLDAVQRKQTQVVFVLTGHCNDLEKPTYKVYQQIAAASSGQVFNLNKTSVHKVLDFVKNSIKGRTVNLGSSVNPAGYNFTQGIPVDSSLGEVTVSVSGAKPQITVVDPAGVQLTGPPKLVTTLDLSEIMVVKVIQPEPGNWTITVGSEEDYSVKVVGLSNLTFNHGFSVEPPGSIAETSYRPLEGTYNHMMVSLSQDLPVNIKYAEILTLGGKTLFELPLKKVEGRTYIANAFIPPDEFFYIAINGKDANGQDIRRVGATAVQAKLPDVPFLSTPKQIKAHSHSRVVLKCKVESLVPVTAMWSKDSARTQRRVSSLQTTTIEYVIEDMTEADVGRYRCSAKNVAGISRATTDVAVLVDPPQVSVDPTNLTLEIGDNANISCTVFSEALLLKFQFLAQNNESHSVVDIAVDPNIDGVYTYTTTVEDASLSNAGNYTCLATNRGGSSNKTAEVVIQSGPTAQILGPHALSAKLHEIVTIYCFVKNSGAIQWSSNGSVQKESKVEGAYTDFLTVNVTDDGYWTCTSVRGNLEASDTVRVSVLLKPSVTILGSKNVTILNGTDVEIACEVTAKPVPRVVWYRGKEEKFLNHTLKVLDNKTYKSTLQLNSSNEDIQGTYFCVGENSVGIHQDSTTVLVRRKMTLLHGFNDSSVQLYQKIDLNCDVDSYPPPKLAWYHNSTELVSSDKIHFFEDRRKTSITRVDFSNLGLYSCVADNGFEKMEVKGSVSVYGLDIPALSKDQPTKRVVKQGESTIFTCSVSGNPDPTIKWEYRSKNSSKFTSVNKAEEGGSKLTLNSVYPKDAGVYRCVAENVVGRDEFQVELVVHYPPQFKSAEQSEIAQKPLEIEVGGNVNFSCEAVGAPSPIVLWNKDGRPLVYGRNAHSSNGTLVIENVTEYDTGLYNCKAKSPMGSVEKDFKLFVYVPPKIVPPTQVTEQEILEGQLVELPCEASGVPSPEVLWQHNGELVAGTDGRKYIDEFGIRFVANLTDFGDYTCTAKNRFGNNSLSYSLFIWVAPYIEPPLKVSKNVIAAQNASLQCDVVGFPLPSIQWQRGDEILQENITDLSFNDVGNLNITNASSQHEGAYVCVAENIAGVAKKVFYLTVNEPPKILEDNYTGPYMATNMDSAVTIACDVTGKPKPYVVWAKDNFYLDKDVRYLIESDGALTIKSPTEDMSGNYTCIAKNTISTTNKTVEVMVYTLPTQMQAEAFHPVVTVMEHTNTSIECPTKASHTDTVKWYKDATFVSSGNLQIANVPREGQTTYVCVVSNAVSSASSAISLSVEWPPKFLSDHETDQSQTKNSGNINKDMNKDRDRKDGDIEYSNYTNENSDSGFPNNPDNKTNDSNSITGILNNKLSRLVSHNTAKNTTNIDHKNETKSNENNNNGTENDKVSNTVSTKNETLNANIKMQNDREAKTLHTDKSVTNLTLTNPNNTVEKTKKKNITKDVQRKAKNNKKATLIIEVVEGDDIYLDCSVDAKPIAKTQWLFNSKLLIFADQARLPLLNVHANNAGAYKCVVGNAHGTLVKEFRVDVLKPPFISDFDILDVLLMEGVNATLDCVPKGAPEPTIQWTYNNSRWHIDNTSLIATKISSSDEGLFRCDARNAAGHTYITYRVGVVVGAKVEEMVTFQNGEGASVTGVVAAKLGSDIRIACKASGKPTPIIQWLRNGQILSENQKNISYADLTIEGVATSHAGVYSCVASNEGGNSEKTLRVEVMEPPKIFRPLFETEKSSGNTVNVEVLSGQAYYLHCHAYGNPLPQLYWFRDGLPLMLFDDTMVSMEYGEVIAVKRALAAQAGNYTCVARNNVGNSSVVYLVDVLVPPPQPKESSRPVTTRVGRPLTLTCPVEGRPAPLVMWSKHPYTEIGKNSPRMMLTQGNATLIIYSTQVSDSGNFSCIMTNKAGTTEVTFDVTIEKPPSIGGHTPGHIETHDVALRKSIVLKCEADGHPLPKITWLKDTQQLSDSLWNVNRVLGNSLLAVWNAAPRDAGQYVCVAENAAGTANTRYNLRVKVPGKWSVWGQWSYCNATCGLGHQQRSRACQYIDDNNNIIDKSSASDKLVLDESACKGSSNETRKCHMPPCEDSSSDAWSVWSRWSPCSVSCGSGTQARTRRCQRKPCNGDNVQIRKCPDLPICENHRDKTENEIFENTVGANENNVFAPEAVFEIEPKVVRSHYSPDIEEFYSATGTKKPTAFYDVAVTSNIDGSDSGPCGVGFRLNASDGVCEDIDECTVASNQCHSTQVCVNVAGAYRCSCQPGLLSLGAGQRCMDINECSQDISGCEYACVNVVGGYVCACPHNMRLHADKHHCYAVSAMGSSYRMPYSYEESDASEFLSTSVEYPARYKHKKN